MRLIPNIFKVVLKFKQPQNRLRPFISLSVLLRASILVSSVSSELDSDFATLDSTESLAVTLIQATGMF